MKMQTINDAPTSHPLKPNIDNLLEDYVYGRISHKNLKIQSGLSDIGVMDAMHASGYRKLIRVHPDDIEEQANHFVRLFENSLQGQQAIAQAQTLGCSQ
jgi:hypothetical protein